MILITRPKTEAKKLKTLLEDLGHTVHIDSLSKISFSGPKKNFYFKNIILISSQQATKIFIKNYLGPKNLPLAVVGNVSYHKLISSGFSNILYKAKDSTQILKYLKKEYSSLKNKYGNKLIYLTGSVTNRRLITNLGKIGFKFEKKIIYKTKFKKSFSPATVALLKKNKIHICLLYSQQNARHFCELVRNKNLSKKCNKLVILTISRNISDLMRNNGYINVKNSTYPSQESLINLLKRL
tara:strand:- start:363 stop:1079 length:717 start_codon:yes stop_codon:yes gene_type:complete